jgi:hypothetical protein
MEDKTMEVSKPRVIKDFDKLESKIQEQIKLVYPEGFSQNLITFTNKDGKLVSALPFETDEKYYLVRMTTQQAEDIISDDEDYDEDGTLKDESRLQFEDKYADLDYIAESIEDPAEEEDDDVVDEDMDDEDDDL